MTSYYEDEDYLDLFPVLQGQKLGIEQLYTSKQAGAQVGKGQCQVRDD